MAKNTHDPYEYQRDYGRIHARIIDAKTGLKEIQGVFAVRIHGRNLNVLIMNDYVPTLGQIDGDVVFLSARGEHPYLGIKGFYKCQHNEFTLLIEEFTDKGAEAK